MRCKYLDSTKLPLTVFAIYLMTQDKKGVSAMKLHRHLGISYNAAWRIRHKLMQVMMERDREQQLLRVGEQDALCFHDLDPLRQSATLNSSHAVERPERHPKKPCDPSMLSAEFSIVYRRFDLPDIIPRLVYVALRTPPMPERLLVTLSLSGKPYSQMPTIQTVLRCR